MRAQRPRRARSRRPPARVTRRLTDQCFRKCVGMYKDPELAVGEATCVDRCVHKYMMVHAKVQEVLAQQTQQQQAGLS